MEESGHGIGVARKSCLNHEFELGTETNVVGGIMITRLVIPVTFPRRKSRFPPFLHQDSRNCCFLKTL